MSSIVVRVVMDPEVQVGKIPVNLIIEFLSNGLPKKKPQTIPPLIQRRHQAELLMLQNALTAVTIKL
jgi:hypothetical protein